MQRLKPQRTTRIRQRALLAALQVAVLASSAQAVEIGAHRALQTGPIGDSPQFADLGHYEAEAALGMTRVFGKFTRNGDSDSKTTGTDFRSRLAIGGGLMATKSFGITATIDATLANDFDEEQTRTEPTTHLDSGLYRHEAGVMAFYKDSPLVFGGGLGILIVGSEERDFIYDDVRSRQQVTSAAMPVLRLFGGIATKDFDGTLGVRFFSMGEAVVQQKDGDKTLQEYDIVRRNPGEVHADARLKLGQAAITGSLAYVLTGQASEQVDEFSTEFETTGDTRTRNTGGARRNQDHFRIAVGGRFDPIKMLGIMGGLTYTGASYAEPQYASLEHENLGGLRFDIGTEVNYDKRFRGFFTAGYQLDSSVSYTVKDDSRSDVNRERTQRTPVDEGDKIKMTQGLWTLVAGGGIVL